MRAAIDAETVFCLSAVLQAVEAASSRARRHDAVAAVLTARVVSCAGADGCLGRDT
jgi:hypothetical protein